MSQPPCLAIKNPVLPLPYWEPLLPGFHILLLFLLYQAIHRLQSWKTDQEITWPSPPSIRQGRCCTLRSTNEVRWWRWRRRSNWNLLRFAPPYLLMGVGLGCLAFWSFPSMLLSPSSSVDKIFSHRNIGWQDFSNPFYLRKEKMLRVT